MNCQFTKQKGTDWEWYSIKNAGQLGEATKITGSVITWILLNPSSLKQVRMPSSFLSMLLHLLLKCKNQFQANWYFGEKSLAASFPITEKQKDIEQL